MASAERSPDLERQYNLALRHPEERQRMLALFPEESARVRAALPGQQGVPYGDGPQETLDIFPAAAGGPAPVLVFVHGGYWRALDKRDFSFVAAPLVAAGVAVVLPNYALAPAVPLERIVEQVRRAVAWTYRNATRFGGDPDRVFVSGHSAGGHLTATTILADWPAMGLPRGLVKGGCAVSGLFDLEPIRQTSINDDLRLDEAGALRFSPVRHLRPGLPPLVVAVGGAESEEFLRQSREFAAAWRATGSPCEEMVMPGLNHFTAVLDLGDAEGSLTRAVRRLVGA